MDSFSIVDVSIILVNYKRADLLDAVINSIIDKSYGFSYEIIVVDNTNDDSCKETKQIVGDRARYLDAKDNLGFGKANNLGAKNSNGKYLFFLNTDTILVNNAIYELYAFMEKETAAGIVGSNLYTNEMSPNHSFYKKEKTLKSERKDLSIVNDFRLHFFSKRKDFNYSNRPLKIDGYICGASLMIRRDLFDKIGGFEKEIFLYAEEALLCYRAVRETGCKMFNVPSSKIIHFEGGSTGSHSLFQFKSLIDGNCVYYLKTIGAKGAIKYLKIWTRYLSRSILLSLFFASRRRITLREKRSYCKDKLYRLKRLY